MISYKVPACDCKLIRSIWLNLISCQLAWRKSLLRASFAPCLRKRRSDSEVQLVFFCCTRLRLKARRRSQYITARIVACKLAKPRRCLSKHLSALKRHHTNATAALPDHVRTTRNVLHRHVQHGPPRRAVHSERRAEAATPSRTLHAPQASKKFA